MIQLKILKGPQKLGMQYEVPVGKSLLLGRSTQCDIQLLSFGISKQHCRLTALPGGKLEMEDLGSSNGTFVNGVQVKHHLLKPGDSLTMSDFLFQIQWKPDVVPRLQAFPSGSQLGDNANPAKGPELEMGSLSGQFARAKSDGGLYQLFSAWIDPVARLFPVHKAIFAGFLLWTLATVLLTVFPFSKESNKRLKENSVEVAKLYARQLARINQRAVIEQRVSDLVATLDERPGLTRGVLKSYLLDSTRDRIMAPLELAGNSLPNAFAVKAVQQNKEWWTYDPIDNLAYVSAPILVGSQEGNSVAATAFVIFDPTKDIFSVPNILNNALTSLIILLAFSLVAAFVYQRFIIAPVQRISVSLDRSLLNGAPFEKTNVSWSDLSSLCERIETMVSRLPQNAGQGNAAPEDWALRLAGDFSLPAAAFDSSLKVMEWNESMGQLTGVRREYAVGADVGVASRDMAFEGSIRELADLALGNPWTPQSKSLDFQGYGHRMTMIFGSNHYLLFIKREDAA